MSAKPDIKRAILKRLDHKLNKELTRRRAEFEQIRTLVRVEGDMVFKFNETIAEYEESIRSAIPRIAALAVEHAPMAIKIWTAEPHAGDLDDHFIKALAAGAEWVFLFQDREPEYGLDMMRLCIRARRGAT